MNSPTDCTIPCKPTCGSCDTNGDCLTCPLGKYLNMDNSVCESCNPRCKICSLFDKNQCLECKENPE